MFFETGIAESTRTPTTAALTKTLSRIRALEHAAAERGLPGGVIGREWRWALAASRLAAERGLAILRYRVRASAGSAERSRLSADLMQLAEHQQELADRFREIWLESYREEGIETALGLHQEAVRALREAAVSLESPRC